MGRGRKFTKEEASAMGKKGGGNNKGKPSPRTKAKLIEQDELRKMIVADLVELYVAWKDSGVGHFVQVPTETGEIKVYKKSPNAQAIKDMFERAFGKPILPVALGIGNLQELVKKACEGIDG